MSLVSSMLGRAIGMLYRRWWSQSGIVEYSIPSGTRPYDVSKRACTQPPETSQPDQISLQLNDKPKKGSVVGRKTPLLLADDHHSQ
ncbi:hypothetical protein LTR02_005661 [Friedmanniomyces endolithicus]|uniref:Uncharacterized protein n=1 Tax=Rachicladosporium monterosium TaxID=1507873 RepID=A0ABR0L6T2_9PEZI|nr:hypothetical protein LTR94_005340 [Friedmanniomyces endolithicus]KAK5144355.1 hypothetical protein LTR32_003709 [Rachicladosporium monterosium]KAK0793535.1 hypothetical protein LTR59_008157 [Friedmanniomyces endolithicus]KAK0801515.1 hypothetical protein LTR38_006821 [Friedmanniomyces endolithicus]KAK0815551.1 hypothetical protein LTR75_003839 [Friedmanniomyces endolithicus]